MGRSSQVCVGQMYGRLLVVKRDGVTPRGAALWLCRCTCGVEKVQRSDQLTTGSSVSCGCYAKEQASARVRTHGMTNTFEHNVWLAMKRRCTDPNHPRYHRYGGRGIKICSRWNKFENFYADMKDCPFDKGSIERVNNDKGYSPSNCKWLPKSEQSKNRSTTRK